MSAELERRLREVPGEFPLPDPRLTRRVERRLLALVRKPASRAQATLLAGALLAAALGTAAWVAAPGSVTLSAHVFRDLSSGALSVRLSGRVAGAAAGETVEILMKECTYTAYRKVSDVPTRPGGLFDETFPSGINANWKPPILETGASYRARWRGRWSNVWTFRMRAHPFVVRRGRGRFSATVHSATVLQSMARKPVVLQRLTPRGWVAVRQARLRAVDARTFSATFVVRTRGLTLRVLVPVRTARPCYNAGASEIFRS